MSQPSEDRVAFTKRNWMGRFLRAEVSYGDLQRIMDRIETWTDWLPAWSETAEHYEERAEAAEQRGARHSAAEAWRRAALCWHFGKFNWFDDIAKAESAQRSLNACFGRALWSLKPPGEKVLIPSCDIDHHAGNLSYRRHCHQRRYLGSGAAVK